MVSIPQTFVIKNYALNDSFERNGCERWNQSRMDKKWLSSCCLAEVFTNKGAYWELLKEALKNSKTPGLDNSKM